MSVASDEPAPAQRQTPGRLLGSATFIMVGNLASRVLGLVREQVIAGYFGIGLEASAFSAAARVPSMIYDLLIGGMLSAAVVPVLSAYAADPERRAELWRVVSVFLTMVALVTGTASLVVYALATPLAGLLAQGLGADGTAVVATYLRVIAPSIMLFGVTGGVIGVLYARERFGPPSVAIAVYNLGLITSVLVSHDRLGGLSLPLGITLGSLLQLGVLWPGLRGGRIRPRFEVGHPALRRILTLYAPIGAGLAVSQLQVIADTRFASAAGEAALASMRYATTLRELPHGLISVAISLAILPALAAAHARREGQTYDRTLARGLRLVLALIVPASVGLAVLADPVVGLVFQRRLFGDEARQLVTAALYVYLIGLPFIGIDWPLNYAFYARQNTRVPALIGVVSVGVYLVFAYVAGPALNLARLPGRWVFLGLVLADSLKHIAHAGIMLLLVRRLIGRDALAGVGRAALATSVAAVVMGAAVWTMDRWLAGTVGQGTLAWGIRAAAGAMVGAAVYLPLAARLDVDEVGWLLSIVRDRITGR